MRPTLFKRWDPDGIPSRRIQRKSGLHPINTRYFMSLRRNLTTTHMNMIHIFSTCPMNKENTRNSFGDTILASSHLKSHFLPPRNRVWKMTIRQWWMYAFAKSIEIWVQVIVNTIIDEPQVVRFRQNIYAAENDVENDFRKITDVTTSIRGCVTRVEYYFQSNRRLWPVIICINQ